MKLPLCPCPKKAGYDCNVGPRCVPGGWGLPCEKRERDRSTAIQIETPLDSTPGKGGPG